MALELLVKKPLQLADGRHTGKITKIEERVDPYHYVDIYIEVDGAEGAPIRYGAPANISPNTKLGKLCRQFTELRPGEKLDVEALLVGKRVSFVSVNETTERGTFARIAEGSVKPLAENQQPQSPEPQAQQGGAAPAASPSPSGTEKNDKNSSFKLEVEEEFL